MQSQTRQLLTSAGAWGASERGAGEPIERSCLGRNTDGTHVSLKFQEISDTVLASPHLKMSVLREEQDLYNVVMCPVRTFSNARPQAGLWRAVKGLCN